MSSKSGETRSLVKELDELWPGECVGGLLDGNLRGVLDHQLDSLWKALASEGSLVRP